MLGLSDPRAFDEAAGRGEGNTVSRVGAAERIDQTAAAVSADAQPRLPSEDTRATSYPGTLKTLTALRVFPAHPIHEETVEGSWNSAPKSRPGTDGDKGPKGSVTGQSFQTIAIRASCTLAELSAVDPAR